MAAFYVNFRAIDALLVCLLAVHSKSDVDYGILVDVEQPTTMHALRGATIATRVAMNGFGRALGPSTGCLRTHFFARMHHCGDVPCAGINQRQLLLVICGYRSCRS